MVLSAQKISENDVQSNTEKLDDETVVIGEPKIKSINEAILSQEVQYFLHYHSYGNPSSISPTMNNLVDIHCKNIVQT
uniref:Uncharacterized protein n=1 Tax=Amphimedon queenslandica TaxID=400682 RepID=A0A1X7V9P9_AMPQE